MRSTILITAILLGACGYATCTAQQYPTKPIRVLTVGGADALVRLLGQKIAESWGQQLVVEERAGAGGTLAAGFVARAPADGYTLLASTSTHVITPNFYKLPYDIVRDFAPVTLIAYTPFVLLVHPSLPVTSAAELIKLAKARPGALNFSASAAGSPAHMVSELFKLSAGVNLVHVPYKSLPAALTDLLAGQVQVAFTVAPLAVPQIAAKRVRALAITAPVRSTVIAGLPTFVELGMPNIVATGWYGLLAPAGTPPTVVNRLHEEIVRILNLPDVRQRVAALGLEVAGYSPRQYADFIGVELAKWARVVKDADLKIDPQGNP
jgi:tripartite-type tricarboxylate transporter receptor subunit TctC